jgi:hypothetical protein
MLQVVEAADIAIDSMLELIEAELELIAGEIATGPTDSEQMRLLREFHTWGQRELDLRRAAHETMQQIWRESGGKVAPEC